MSPQLGLSNQLQSLAPMVTPPSTQRRSLLRFPNELLHEVGALLRDDPDSKGGRSALAALSSACRLFNDIFESYLYQSDARHNDSFSVVWGAANGNIKTLEKAVLRGADVRAGFVQLPGYDGKGTAIHYAARNGHDEAIQWLVDHGSRPLSKRGLCLCECYDEVGQTSRESHRNGTRVSPLHLAICHGNISTVRLLIDMDPSVYATNPDMVEKTSIMCTAAAHGHHCLFDALLDGLDARTFVQRRDIYGNTMFHYAARSHGNVDTIRALADLGCGGHNYFNHKGWTPMAQATSDGRWDLATAFLEMGGSMYTYNSLTMYWERELRRAFGNYESRDRVGTEGQPSLEALSQWRQEALKFMGKLVRRFLSPSAQSLESKLSWAMFNVVDGSFPWNQGVEQPAKAVQILINLGADPNYKNLDGGTVLHCILLPDTPKEDPKGKGKGVENEDPKAQLDKEMTFLANKYHKHSAAISQLLKQGASLEIKDDNGLTPIEYLVKHYNPRRLDPSAMGNPAYRLLVLKFVRLMVAFAKPPTIAKRTRSVARAEKESEINRWKAWTEKEANDLEKEAKSLQKKAYQLEKEARDLKNRAKDIMLEAREGNMEAKKRDTNDVGSD